MEDLILGSLPNIKLFKNKEGSVGDKDIVDFTYG